MNWLHYLIEANLYLAVFYAVYCLFLNKETHYTLNRVYLLLTSAISFILPVIQVGLLKPAAEYAQQAYVTIAPSASKNTATQVANNKLALSALTLQDVIWYVYLAGIAVLSVILIIKIARLIKMTAHAKTIANNDYKLVGINDSNTAFSFFNYLFIGTKTTGSELIIQHELVHIRQKHSVDILFIELLRIINWFNPIIYLIQLSVKTVHEYIADEQTAAYETDVISYSSFLVDNAYGLNGSSVTHSFFNYNLLKKRIIMLNQKRSGNLARLKYLMALPICAGMLCASTLAFSKNYALIDLMPNSNASPLKTNAKGPILPPPGLTKTKNVVIPSTEPVFNDLAKFIAKTARYPQAARENNVQGNVFALFNVDENHKVSSAKIVSGIGYGFADDVMEKMPSFPNAIDVKPGTYKLKMSFSLANDSGYDENNPVPQVKAAPFTADLEVVIVAYGISKGITPVNTSKIKVSPPAPPAVAATPVAPPPTLPDFADFYKYIAKHVRYPAADHDNHIGGRVIATFEIVDGKIIDPTIARSVEPVMDGELLRVLKAYDGSLKLAAGHYSMPVSFQVIDSKNNQVGHLPENYTNVTQKTTADKPAKQSNSFSTSLMLDEVVVTTYTKD